MILLTKTSLCTKLLSVWYLNWYYIVLWVYCNKKWMLRIDHCVQNSYHEFNLHFSFCRNFIICKFEHVMVWLHGDMGNLPVALILFYLQMSCSCQYLVCLVQTWRQEWIKAFVLGGVVLAFLKPLMPLKLFNEIPKVHLGVTIYFTLF